MTPPLPGDKQGGFTGLIVGGVLLLLILYSIVHLTNVHYSHLEATTAKAAATQ